MPTSVYLIRHGHGHDEHRPSPQGTEASCDFGLSERGRAQVAALAERLHRTGEIQAHVLCCSTLPRAVQTAEAIGPALRCGPARRQHRFVPGFETIAEFSAQVQGALDSLIQQHEDRSLVLVVHGGVIEAAFHHFLGFGPGPFEGGYPAADHASITLWRRAGRQGNWVQRCANDTHHLDRDGRTSP